MRAQPRRGRGTHWMDVARLGIRLAREAVDEGGREGDALWRSRSPRRSTRPAGGERSISSAGCSRTSRPDLILLETLTLIRDPRRSRPWSAARDRASGVAELPPLPPRRLRRLRPALGPAGGRPVRPRRPPLRGDGRRRAAHQLPAGRPRSRDAVLAARLHRHAARRVPEPRLPRGAGWRFDDAIGPEEYAAAGAAPGGRRARRSSAAAAASAPTTSRRRARRCRHEAGPRAPAGERRDRPATARGRSAAPRPVARRAGPRRCSRCRSPSSRSTRASSRRPRAATSSGSTCSATGSAPASAASTSAAAAASSPSSWRSTAPPASTPSTSTATPSPTRWPTPSATASPTA